MKLTLYQVDAFADKLFKGNPAAVIPLDRWISDTLMQQLAMENNLSETVFFVKSEAPGTDYDIRWFTPAKEINLCGHATLASAFVIFQYLHHPSDTITFSCLSGQLIVKNNNDVITMDFPAWQVERLTDYPADLAGALGVTEIVGVYQSRDLVVELASEAAVQNAEPDFTRIKKPGSRS